MISDNHDVFDDRIYAKETLSLQRNGYSVSHICVGLTDENFISEEGIKIIQLQRKRHFKSKIINKLYKIFFVRNLYKEILKQCLLQKADIYHIHDYKLIKTAIQLKKRSGSKIIFDIHDPFYQNIIDYNKGSFLKEFISKLQSQYIQYTEKKYIKQFDKLITTEENLAERYKTLYAWNMTKSELYYPRET